MPSALLQGFYRDNMQTRYPPLTARKELPVKVSKSTVIKVHLELLANVLLPWVLLAWFGWSVYNNPREVLENTAIVIGCIYAVWFIVPHLQIWSVKDPDITSKIKRDASLFMLKMVPRAMLQMVFATSAFFVVPIVVTFFTKNSANRLPGLFQKYYGDKNGIDGDNVYWVEMIRPDGTWGGWRIPIPENPTPEQWDLFDEHTYFPGIRQKTKRYRILWLLRNRSTKFAMDMGVNLESFHDTVVYGTRAPFNSKGPNRQMGLQLMVAGKDKKAYEIAQLVDIGGKAVFRTRWGVKVANEASPWNTNEDVYRWPRAEQTSISFSIKKN